VACRTIFLSLPAPREVEAVVGAAMETAQAGDVVVDRRQNCCVPLCTHEATNG
jgi:hypothetical protein